jgi:hypothetical protein
VVSTTQVDLKWDDNSLDETDFGIYRKTGTAEWVKINTTSANTTSFSDKGALASTTYLYRVQAGRADMVSLWSNEVSATTLTPPPAATTPAQPHSVSAVMVSATQVNVSWPDPNIDETGYEVHRQNGNLTVKIATLPADATKFTDSTAVPDSGYFYKVRAVRGTTFSAFTTSSEVRTPPAPAPPPDSTSSGTIFGALDAGGESVRDGVKGEVITFRGTNLGPLPGTATVAGLPAAVVSWTDNEVQLALPEVPVWIHGRVMVTPPNREPLQSLFEFAVTTGVGSPEEPETQLHEGAFIDSYCDLMGNEYKEFKVGSLMMITGYKFGTAGRFFIGAIQVPTVSWSESRIVLEVPDMPNLYHNKWITLSPTGGGHLTTSCDWKIVPATP